MSVSVYVSISIYVSIKYGATNISADMAIIQSISKARTRWRGNLKGLSLERGWTKSAESLGASPLKRDLSVDITFS